MPKSLLALQNDRRMAERRHVGYERRNLPDRRKKSEEVSEERRRKERRVLHERRMQERRMHDFQTNIMKKDVLEKEEHALITSRGLDEEEMEDNSNEIKEVIPPKYEKIYEDELSKGFIDDELNMTTIGIAIVSIVVFTFILYKFILT
jgi:hypothetical protein